MNAGASDPAPGNVIITSGSTSTTATGGYVSINGGPSISGNGGDIILSGGTGNNPGRYLFNSGPANFKGELSFSNITTSDKAYQFPDNSGEISVLNNHGSTPSNQVTPAAWAETLIIGVQYWIPLYQ